MARSLKGMFNKETLAMALGGATSGTISGFAAPILAPITGTIPVAGLSEIIVGAGGMYLLKSKGLIGAYFKGVFIAGLSNAIAGFIPQVAGTFPSGKKQLTTSGGSLQAQVDGAQHFYPELDNLYLHRNPIMGSGNVSETTQAPAGTTHLHGKMPSISQTL